MKVKSQDAVSSRWPTVRLGDVCSEVRDRIASSAIDRAQYVTTDNMLKNCTGIKVAENLPPDVGLVRYRVGDVLTSNIRPYLKKAWLADRDGGCSSDVIVYRADNPDLSPDYLYAVISSDRFFDYSMKNVSGAKMPRGKRDWLEKFEFPLPPLAKQKRIVAKLEKELARVEAMKAKFELMATAAEKVFKATLAEEFEGLENGTDGTSGANGTRRVRLGDVFKFIDYRGITPHKVKSGIPLITARNVRFGYMDYSVEAFITKSDYAARQTRGIAQKGDILFTTEAPLGFVAIADKETFSTGQRIITFQWLNNSHDYCASYHLYYMMSDLFQSQVLENATGALAQGIKSSRLINLTEILPSLPAQREIVSRLDAAKARCEGIAAKARAAVATCEKLRKAILAEAFR